MKAVREREGDCESNLKVLKQLPKEKEIRHSVAAALICMCTEEEIRVISDFLHISCTLLKNMFIIYHYQY